MTWDVGLVESRRLELPDKVRDYPDNRSTPHVKCLVSWRKLLHLLVYGFIAHRNLFFQGQRAKQGATRSRTQAFDAQGVHRERIGSALPVSTVEDQSMYVDVH